MRKFFLLFCYEVIEYEFCGFQMISGFQFFIVVFYKDGCRTVVQIGKVIIIEVCIVGIMFIVFVLKIVEYNRIYRIDYMIKY